MSINVDLFYFINHNMHNPIFDLIMPLFTHFGGFIFMVCILVAVILFARFTKRNTLKRIAILALIALLLSDVIVLCLKHIVNEPRPFMVLDNVNLLIVEDDPYSFPSGHTASTFSVITFFVLNMKELVKKHYLAVNTALIIFALIIPFSRVYVGVHYPGDVFAGALIGMTGALFVNHFKDKILGIL